MLTPHLKQMLNRLSTKKSRTAVEEGLFNELTYLDKSVDRKIIVEAGLEVAKTSSFGPLQGVCSGCGRPF